MPWQFYDIHWTMPKKLELESMFQWINIQWIKMDLIELQNNFKWIWKHIRDKPEDISADEIINFFYLMPFKVELQTAKKCDQTELFITHYQKRYFYTIFVPFNNIQMYYFVQICNFLRSLIDFFVRSFILFCTFFLYYVSHFCNILK